VAHTFPSGNIFDVLVGLEAAPFSGFRLMGFGMRSRNPTQAKSACVGHPAWVDISASFSAILLGELALKAAEGRNVSPGGTPPATLHPKRKERDMV